MHIVLIRFSSMGDIVLQTPFISWLKSQFPKCRITFITSSQFTGLIEGHPFIDNVIGYDRLKGMDDIRALKALSTKITADLKADFIIDLHGTTRGKLIRFFCHSIPSIKVYKRGLSRFLLVALKIDLLKRLETHHERLIQDFKVLFGKPYNKSDLMEFIQVETKLKHKTLNTTGLSFKTELKPRVANPYIVISPVASFKSKRWPISNFVSLADTILNSDKFRAFSIIILAGPDDKYCSEFDLIKSERLLNLQGKTSVNESNEILAHTVFAITNDTGVAHMCESFARPVISFFGPTSPSFGFPPHLADSKVLMQKPGCSPCSNTGARNCHQKRHICMEDITVDMAFEAAQTLLAKRWKP
jgi:lipopolysaccharide heptosyltransferase II